jgi:hypothetical protein
MTGVPIFKHTKNRETSLIDVSRFFAVFAFAALICVQAPLLSVGDKDFRHFKMKRRN